MIDERTRWATFSADLRLLTASLDLSPRITRATVTSTSGPPDGPITGCLASHTSGGTIRCSHSRPISFACMHTHGDRGGPEPDTGHSGPRPLGGAHRLSWPTGCSASAARRGKVVEQEHSEDAGEPLFRLIDALIATARYGTDDG
jgi:hypothetical protein